MISYIDVTKRFPNAEKPAVNGVSLEVKPGETLALLGSSGCGKTTLLRLTNRLVEPTAGRIEIDGEDISIGDAVDLRRRIGYVFQGIGLFPHLTVGDNVAIALRLLGWSRARQIRRVHEMLDLMGLAPSEFSYRYPVELSGGQQQRVGVARALAADPSYLLMDEPFGALDAITRNALQEEIVRIQKVVGKTIVFVTHDIVEAFRLGDRVAVMHQGVVDQVGSRRQLLQHPATAFVREIIQKPAQQLASLGLAAKPAETARVDHGPGPGS